MKRVVQQAKQVQWPVREEYVKSPSRATTADVLEIVWGVIVMGSVFLAIVAMLFLVAGLGGAL